MGTEKTAQDAETPAEIGWPHGKRSPLLGLVAGLAGPGPGWWGQQEMKEGVGVRGTVPRGANPAAL